MFGCRRREILTKNQIPLGYYPFTWNLEVPTGQRKFDFLDLRIRSTDAPYRLSYEASMVAGRKPAVRTICEEKVSTILRFQRQNRSCRQVIELRQTVTRHSNNLMWKSYAAFFGDDDVALGALWGKGGWFEWAWILLLLGLRTLMIYLSLPYMMYVLVILLWFFKAAWW